ncbi:permease-like cell division protein FtsX [Microbacterium gorillae]|uniref:permease-like cell division protein FtsX n=1 Tax=Microbacterium gorillae TaxID=1231063 RepID=UPI00058D0570|nr:permease-like cell division protein FtsX [Microbacterium gorillae]
MRVGLIISEVLQGLRRNLSMVISVILVTFVSLTFVGAAILTQAQVSKLHEYWEDRAQVQIILCSSSMIGENCTGGAATKEQTDAVEAELTGKTLGPLIQNYTFESQQQAYDNLMASVDKDYASVLAVDQMNASFKINLKDQGQTDVLTEAFHATPGVQEVKNQLKYLDPLFQSLTVATYIAVGIAVLMLVAAVLLIATTIRLSAYARRKEIGIMRLVGASNRFIQTPFVLEGVVAAFIGTILASGAIIAAVHFGIDGYLRSRVGFISSWVGMGDAFVVVPILVVIGVVLAALSAGFAIRRWLRA